MFKQREEAIMRRKIMTAFVCAIMTISVIPVYADDTQIAEKDGEGAAAE